MSKRKQYEVVVVGSGVTGLSACWHLAQHQINKVALAGPLGGQTQSAQTAGVVAGGMVDNFTRVSHAHSAEFAKDLWNFGNQAFLELANFADSQGVAFKRYRRLRLITSEAELNESRLAVDQMKEAGFSATFKMYDQHQQDGLSERVLAVQEDGDEGGYLDPKDLLDALDRHDQFDRVAEVVNLERDKDSNLMKVSLRDGRTLFTELVIVASHLGIGSLIPNLKEALIGVADQWCDVELTTTEDFITTQKFIYSANHTYEWGAPIGPNKWRIGGGRFLRPMAGIEASTTSVHQKITNYLGEQFKKTFRGISATKATFEQGIIDCRPCDELPIIGPMYGESRLLVATGYMGGGLTLGFLAGKCLAELIAIGKCESLPRRLWPERLRSMEIR
jgi:glycine/D-amino acid oxidase-like deaminating enzyme